MSDALQEAVARAIWASQGGELDHYDHRGRPLWRRAADEADAAIAAARPFIVAESVAHNAASATPEERNTTMHTEVRQILQAAQDEIRNLRRVVNELAPKAEAYGALVAVITRLQPERPYGAGEDVVWKLAQVLNGDWEAEQDVEEKEQAK